MEKWLHIEIYIVCISILIQLIYYLGKNGEGISNCRIFRLVLAVLLGVYINDGIWILVDGQPYQVAYQLNVLSGMMYFILSGISGLMWLCYIDYRFYRSWKRLYSVGPWYTLPAMILCGASICSVWTKCLYYIDESNRYQRGPFYFIFTMIVYGYLVYTAILAIYCSNKTIKSCVQKEERELVFFCILPLVGGLVQSFVVGVPVIWVFVMLSILMLFMSIQSNQIFTDGLTGVNNRRQLNKYLENQMRMKHEAHTLYLLLIDIDFFKKINDTYGHIEGDHALICIADILKKICNQENAFLARYGGDEFAIVCKRKDEALIKRLKCNIQEAVQQANEKRTEEYNLSLSIGYATYAPLTMKNPDQLIEDADKMLYSIKETKKRKVQQKRKSL